MDINLIDNTSRRYCKYGIWLTSALTFAVIIAISVNWLDISLVSALAVSALYSIIVNLAYGSLWKRIAKSAPGTMAKFYLAASALRLITAALVVIVFCVINRSDKELIRNFIFTDSGVMNNLRHHRAIHGSRLDRTTFCIFFAKLHKSPCQ